MFFIYESPAPMKGEVFMKNERELDVSREMSVEEVYAEYVKKDITDDFIFGKIMLKEANCIDLLECLTGNRIESVSTVVSQKAVRITSDSKGVRYDIYVEDDKNIMYDAEMQNYTETTSAKNLPKRSRFYQGIMDSDVAEARQNREWMVEYMKTLVHDMDVMNEGIAKGRAQGRDEGEVINFIKLVRKKIEKGKSVDKIADELEETVDAVQKIYDIIEMYGEKVSIDDIYNKLQE